MIRLVWQAPHGVHAVEHVQKRLWEHLFGHSDLAQKIVGFLMCPTRSSLYAMETITLINAWTIAAVNPVTRLVKTCDSSTGLNPCIHM